MAFRLFILLTFVFIGRPQDYLTFLVPLRPALILSVLTLLVTIVSSDRGPLFPLLKHREIKWYAWLYGLMVMGIPFAAHRRLAFEGVIMGYSLNIFFFCLCLIHIRSVKRLQAVLSTIALSVFLYGAYSLARGGISGGRLEFGGMYDPNDLAYFFVSLMPLCYYAYLQSRGLIVKYASLGAVLLTYGLVILTGSRGGLIGLAVVSSMMFLTRYGSVSIFKKIAAVLAILISLFIFGDRLDFSRFLSIGSMQQDYNITSSTGRLEIWKTGFKLIRENPITGVGFDCFGMAFGFTRESEGLIPVWKTAHNSYILLAAEIGLPAFFLFIGLIILSVKNFMRAVSLRGPPADMEALQRLAGLALCGFAGNLVCTLFLSQSYNFRFTFYFALSFLLRYLPGILTSASEEGNHNDMAEITSTHDPS